MSHNKSIRPTRIADRQTDRQADTQTEINKERQIQRDTENEKRNVSKKDENTVCVCLKETGEDLVLRKKMFYTHNYYERN